MAELDKLLAREGCRADSAAAAECAALALDRQAGMLIGVLADPKRTELLLPLDSIAHANFIDQTGSYFSLARSYTGAIIYGLEITYENGNTFQLPFLEAIGKISDNEYSRYERAKRFASELSDAINTHSYTSLHAQRKETPAIPT